MTEEQIKSILFDNGYTNGEYGYFVLSDPDQAAAEIMKLMQGWVSVEERTESGLCIVQYYNPSDQSKQPYVIPLWRGRSGWYYDNSEKEPAEDDTLKVTHWQPMPSPLTPKHLTMSKEEKGFIELNQIIDKYFPKEHWDTMKEGESAVYKFFIHKAMQEYSDAQNAALLDRVKELEGELERVKGLLRSEYTQHERNAHYVLTGKFMSEADKEAQWQQFKQEHNL